jgi:hypothetical protein
MNPAAPVTSTVSSPETRRFAAGASEVVDTEFMPY